MKLPPFRAKEVTKASKSVINTVRGEVKTELKRVMKNFD
jgi:hypothetical protein